MKKIVITKAGAVDVLRLEDFPIPKCNPGEVLIKVHAAGVNFADIMARLGMYQDAPPLPTTVGYEVAGTIEDVGEGVNSSNLGRRVMALTRFHGQAEYVLTKVENCFDISDEFSFVQAAAIPVNYLTAYVLMVVMGSLKKDQTILIQNAGGGVGLAALQLAKIIGAKTIGTASAGKHSRLLEMGMENVVNYRENNWDKKVLEISADRGVDLIIDPLGSKSWKKSYPLLRHSGRMGIFGASEMSQGSFRLLSMMKTLISMPWFHPLSMLQHNRGVFGVNMGHLWHEAEMVNNWTKSLMEIIKAHEIKPVVHKTFRFSDVALAHLELQERRNFGKVVLIPDELY